MNKKWYQSKTLWVNAIAVVIIGVQYAAGSALIAPELQTAILAAINVILRSITDTNITM